MKKNIVKMDIDELFKKAVENAHTTGQLPEFQVGAYGVEVKLPMDTGIPLDRDTALEAIRAAQRFDFSTIRAALEEWVEGEYDSAKCQAIADASALMTDFLNTHPEIKLTDCDSDEQEIIDDTAREVEIIYPDYSGLFAEHFPNVDIDGEGEEIPCCGLEEWYDV